VTVPQLNMINFKYVQRRFECDGHILYRLKTVAY